MKQILFIVGTLIGLAFTFGSPPSPQPIAQNGEYAHFDVQVHTRVESNGDFADWLTPMQAEHGTDCAPPPATHTVQALSQSVFICNDHVMTALNGSGYGEAVITPSQLLDCSVSCTVQWDMSTERQSQRDWPDVWLTPWLDNLALPFDAGDVDLQGVPRQGLHFSLTGPDNSWIISGISNYTETTYGIGSPSIQSGILAGTNQAAVRQSFRVTVTGSSVRMERLASASATGVVYFFGVIPGSLGADNVVQFAHHSYNPTKDNSGVPATWHWSGFQLNPAVPFSLIHTTPALVNLPSPVMFNSPAPAGAYLRFSAVCRVLIDGVLATRQTFLGHPEHASDYFIPIAQGKTGVNVTFLADDWYSGPCAAQDFHVWSKGGPSSTPTPSATTIPTASPSPSSTPSASPTTSVPTATLTPARAPTATPALSTPTPATVCSQAYFKNHVLTEGAAIPCP